MKRLLTLLLASVLFGCGESYDDSALTGRVDDLENRVAKLEELCKQMNTNISSLQTLVNALQNKDCITSVVPITKDGEIIGYTISFTQSAPITIYNGQDGKDGQDGKPGEDGKDGSTPVIGVKQDADGIYYWTLNGDWLTDDSGNKIKAEGRDGQDGEDGKPGQDGKPGESGKDGITPQLRIENGYWQISYNDGASWIQLGKATGDKGEQGDPLFQTVEDNDNNVVFTLNDGTTITIPKVSESTFNILFNKTVFHIEANATYKVAYTIIGGDENTEIELIANNGYEATVNSSDYQTGEIIVQTPASLMTGKILVFVSKGAQTVMRVLNFVERTLIVSNDTIDAGILGGTYKVNVKTNVNYTVEIPIEAQEWISLAETRATISEETLTFTIARNEVFAYRYAVIKIIDDNGNTAQTILVTQSAEGYTAVHVEVPGRLFSYLITTTGRLKITGKLNDADFEYLRTYIAKTPAFIALDISQIENTTLPRNCFKQENARTIEIILPWNLTEVPDYALYNCRSESTKIPKSVTSIGDYAFYGCGITELSLPEGLTTIGEHAFAGCSNSNLTIPDSVIEIGAYAFYSRGFGRIKKLNIGSGLKKIPEYCFGGALSVEDLIIPDNVQSIGDYAFYDSYVANSITLGKGIIELGDYIYNKQSKRYLYCKMIALPDLTGKYAYPFDKANGGYFEKAYVPKGYRKLYASAGFWVDVSLDLTEYEF